MYKGICSSSFLYDAIILFSSKNIKSFTDIINNYI